MDNLHASGAAGFTGCNVDNPGFTGRAHRTLAQREDRSHVNITCTPPALQASLDVDVDNLRASGATGFSVDLFLTNGKRMVKALPMALPGASQGCRTLGYDRGGDKAPQTRSNGCREIVFGHDAPLWSEPFNRSRTVMAAVRVAHPPAPRRHPRELSYHPQHP